MISFRHSERGAAGFTLIEAVMVIALISILAATSVAIISDNSDSIRFETTRSKMEAIRVALIGDTALDNQGHRTNFGFVGDWGSLPDDLDWLTDSQNPAWSYDSTYGFGSGWKGPYLATIFDGLDSLKDAWDRAFAWDETANPPILTSTGSDGAAGGTGFATDLIMEFPTTLWKGTVYGKVLDGTTPQENATVEIRYPVDGVNTPATTTTDADGYFTFANVPFGVRSLRVTSAPTLGPVQVVVDTSKYAVPPSALNYSTSAGTAAAEDRSLAGGRLTLTTNVPVTTGDVTAAGTLYYTPYTHNKIALHNGTSWSVFTFTQRSLALSATADKNYDVFLYNNSGTLTLELSAEWTDDTTRADAITRQDGVWVKSGATTRRYLGTIRASGANVCEDSNSKRFVFNASNRVQRVLQTFDTTNSWSNAGDGTWSAVNSGNASWKHEFVIGLAEEPVRSEAIVTAESNTHQITIAIDSTTPSRTKGTWSLGAHRGLASFSDQPSIGYHYLQAVETTSSAATVTVYGDNSTNCGSGSSCVNSGMTTHLKM